MLSLTKNYINNSRRLLRKIGKYIINPNFRNELRYVLGLYKKYDYITAYSLHNDYRVNKDPRQAMGGNWEEAGRLQFDILLKLGLENKHDFLDIGCGTLRGGVHFINFLDKKKYTGFDISDEAISFSNKHVSYNKSLRIKEPKLIHSINKRFNSLTDEKFDYVLAYSVFSNLPQADIEECIRNLKPIMHKDSIFIFTYLEGNKNRRLTLKDFCYTEDFFIKIASKYGFKYIDISHMHNHPKKHKLIIYKL